MASDDSIMMIVEMSDDQEERRVRRAVEPKQALCLFLDAARVRLGVHSLTVGTSEGHLVAGAGDDTLLVAALGAKVDSGEQTSKQVATWRLQIGDRVYLITSLGARLNEDVGAGVRRILS